MQAMKNVIPLRVPKTISVPLHKLDGMEGVALVSRLIRQWERESKENTFKALAQRAGLWPNTVARIASHDTKAPRLHTILMIMGALGFTAVRFD